MSSTTSPLRVERRGSSLNPAFPTKSTFRWLSPGERDALVLSTFIKVLLFPAYRSTDFEVHRNWLAITYSLPMSKWYFDVSLDYPPFFAYFEFLLSLPARIIDRRIVQLSNLNYDSMSVVVYQRSTVILTELVLGAALLRFVRGSVDQSTARVIAVSLFLHPGFLIVDHIHFQYNGFMFGILLWSVLMAREGRHLASGVLFAILLNFKHIYVYLAPAYFVYLLRVFCLSSTGAFLPAHFISLANSVVAVFVTSFGPFILMKNDTGHIGQIFRRLFPFTRGLNHAYWAPNFWALVTALDRVLLKCTYHVRWKGLKVELRVEGVVSTSRGLVGDTVFAVLPNIEPVHTFVLTLLCQGVFLAKLWTTPTYKSFLAALTLCGWSSFMFGWHVHEKAILLVLVPLSLVAAESSAHMRTFMIASVAGIFSLFPLLFTPSESIAKVLYSLIWGSVVFVLISKRVYEFPEGLLAAVLDRVEKAYLMGFTLLQLFVSLYPTIGSRSSPRETLVSVAPQFLGMGSGACSVPFGIFTQPELDMLGDCTPPSPPSPPSSSVETRKGGEMEFLPLMVTSVYCAVGLVWAFLRLSYLYLSHSRKPLVA
ncbi:glycosyltransferase family 57 protein [Hydnum rufescens UP504]|uniref:Alpha-1,3-glucosyltransferase n=1 Tax=Hydnum rufescens UP504 TaxID=1448309 RepID=A0A9P6DWY2_9AGAM|nr:glycosyltransferase family 57 protein [Hydnum rufescens UP504]